MRCLAVLNSASPAAGLIRQTRLTRLWSHMLQTTVGVTHSPRLFPTLLPQLPLFPPLKNSSVFFSLLLLLLFQFAGDLNGPH